MTKMITVCSKCNAAKVGTTIVVRGRDGCDGNPHDVPLTDWRAPDEWLTPAGLALLRTSQDKGEPTNG